MSYQVNKFSRWLLGKNIFRVVLNCLPTMIVGYTPTQEELDKTVVEFIEARDIKQASKIVKKMHPDVSDVFLSGWGSDPDGEWEAWRLRSQTYKVNSE